MELIQAVRKEQMYVAVRHVGAYSTIGEAFGRLKDMAAKHNIVAVGPRVAVFHDDPHEVPEERLQSEAAIPVNATYDLEHTGLHGMAIPGGNFVAMDYIGPYSGLGEAWETFFGLIEAEKLAPRVNPRWVFEEYLNDCSVVGDAHAHTRLYCGLK